MYADGAVGVLEERKACGRWGRWVRWERCCCERGEGAESHKTKRSPS